MDTVKMQSVLNNYKKILGDGCDSCISQADEAMLSKVTGKSNFINYLGFLFNVIDYIENEGKPVTKDVISVENEDVFNGLYERLYDEVKAENEKLVASNNELVEKVKSMEGLIVNYAGKD